MRQLKITSIKSLGVKDVYNVAMKGDQHNYAININDVSGCVVYTSNSHAYAYAALAMQCAYMKAHYPLYYMKAILNAETMDSKFDNVIKYMKTCINMNIKVLPCNVNKSKAIFTIEGKKIRRGLASVKGVGLKASIEIEKYAPFKDLEDFVEKTSEISVVNKKVVESLILDGVFCDLKIHGDEGVEAYLEMRGKVDYMKKRNIQKSSMFDLSGVSFV